MGGGEGTSRGISGRRPQPLTQCNSPVWKTILSIYIYLGLNRTFFVCNKTILSLEFTLTFGKMLFNINEFYFSDDDCYTQL